LDNYPTGGCLSDNVLFSPSFKRYLINQTLPEKFQSGVKGVIKIFSGTIHMTPFAKVEER
jgi:hypothetical protein